jgi:hypothetical protein
MAAGLGFKTFTTGEVLTAGDVNGYLMQGINVFASEAARNSAITSPQEGQFAFTKDNNSLWYYTGSAWAASGATGDIEGVTAGVGISGGGTSGTVTVTNSMATAIDAKGDLVPGTGADTFARLAVGANGTVLTADSAETTGLKWATPASGTTFSGASVTDAAAVSVPNGTYTALTFTQEQYDTDSYHSNSTNTSRLTIPSGKTGYYQVNAQVVYNTSSGGGIRYLSIYKNGSFFYASGDVSAPSGQYPRVPITLNAYLSAGDYIEIYAYQTSGGNLNCFIDDTQARFQINYLGA